MKQFTHLEVTDLEMKEIQKHRKPYPGDPGLILTSAPLADPDIYTSHHNGREVLLVYHEGVYTVYLEHGVKKRPPDGLTMTLINLIGKLIHVGVTSVQMQHLLHLRDVLEDEGINTSLDATDEMFLDRVLTQYVNHSEFPPFTNIKWGES